MKIVILIYQVIQEKIANGELFMLVMIEYIFMFRIVKKMQNSGLEIVAGLTLPLSSILCDSITHVFHKQHVKIFCATVNFGGLHHYYTLHRLSVQIEVPSRGSISKKKVGLPI